MPLTERERGAYARRRQALGALQRARLELRPTEAAPGPSSARVGLVRRVRGRLGDVYFAWLAWRTRRRMSRS